jgi:hypothetical protein
MPAHEAAAGRSAAPGPGPTPAAGKAAALALLLLILAAVLRLPQDAPRDALPDRASGTPVAPAAARAPGEPDASLASSTLTESSRGAPDAAAASTRRVQAAPPPPADGCAALARWSRSTLGYDALLCRAGSGVFALRPTAQFALHDDPDAFARVVLQGAAWLTQEGIAPATARYVIPDRGGTPPCLALSGIAAAQWLRRSLQPGIDAGLEWRRAAATLRRTDCPPPAVS